MLKFLFGSSTPSTSTLSTSTNSSNEETTPKNKSNTSLDQIEEEAMEEDSISKSELLEQLAQLENTKNAEIEKLTQQNAELHQRITELEQQIIERNSCTVPNMEFKEKPYKRTDKRD